MTALVVDDGDPRLESRPGDRRRATDLVAGADLDADAAALRERVLALCAGEADPLERSSLPDHLTASAVVVAPGRGALLLRHRKLGRWLQPGGHVDGDGNLLAGARREAEEETGLEGLRAVLPAVDLDVHDVDYPDGSFHVHHDLRFLLLAPEGASPRANHESTGLRWVASEAELDVLDVDVSTRRVVRRGIEVAEALGVATGWQQS